MGECKCDFYLVRNKKGERKAKTLYNNRSGIRNFCITNLCPGDGVIDDNDTERMGIYIIPNVIIPKKCWEGMH